jgi:archaellum component FlaC
MWYDHTIKVDTLIVQKSRMPQIKYIYSQYKWKGDIMHRSVRFIVVLVLMISAACAQVPKESVELSTTVGRDVAEVYRAHRELAVIMYERIENDVNKFVDDVYAPYQIRKLLQADHQDFKRRDPNSLFSALDAAIRQPDSSSVQKTAVDAMDVFVQILRAEVEDYRAERLAPVLVQKKKILAAIDRSYRQIHYGNSIVTGYLASVVKVHDAQQELLNEFGLENLNQEIGQRLADISNKVSEFTEKAKKVEGSVADMEKKINKLTQDLDRAVEGLSD